MKIAFISDLHVDSSPQCFAVLDDLVHELTALRPDVFIIAGDVAASTVLFEKALRPFAGLPCHKLLVAGNHDIWVDSPAGLQQGIHSGVKYDEIIPGICERNGFAFLGETPRIIEGMGFAGTIGWYDYSLRNRAYDGTFPLDTYRAKHYGERFTWNDLKFARWMNDAGRRIKSDEEVAGEMEASLGKQLVQLTQQGITRTVVVTHHVPFREMILYPHLLPFDFFSAYMGSEGLGAVIASHPTVCQVICGHSHIKSSVVMDRFTAMKSPLGYYREWRTANRAQLLKERLTCVEIPSSPGQAQANE
jgi:Icc-related predicted phosphoesterase